MDQEEAKALAEGCGDCRYGILLAPEPVKHLPLYVARMAALDNTTFCTCQAGVWYEAFLRKAKGKQDEEDKRKGFTVTGHGGTVTSYASIE